ncbi:MAG: hypothetical protein E7660_00760 [Ruminococcaceae bacterium]|nr:hypothetical protein [Oscillospiraceae bacterium]
MDAEFIQNADQKPNAAPYPIVYCDENLNVADISPTAKSGNFSHLQGLSLKKHLSAKDISALSAYIRNHSGSYNSGIFVDINNVKGTKCAHVTAVKLFGKNYFEMRLFRSRTSMFKDFDVSRIMLSDVPYVPQYDLSRDRITVNETREKLSKTFSAGYLKNLYYSALEPFRREISFEPVDATRRIFADLPYGLELGGTKFSLSVRNEEAFIHNIIDVSNYVNLVAVFMKMFCAVTKTGNVSCSMITEEDRVSLLFSTSAKEPSTLFAGGFAFDLIADAYPETASLVWAAKYIGALFGIRCYAELSGKDTLTAEILMRKSPPDIEIGVMHPHYKELEELCRTAAALSVYLENEEVKKYFI